MKVIRLSQEPQTLGNIRNCEYVRTLWKNPEFQILFTELWDFTSILRTIPTLIVVLALKEFWVSENLQSIQLSSQIMTVLYCNLYFHLSPQIMTLIYKLFISKIFQWLKYTDTNSRPWLSCSWAKQIYNHGGLNEADERVILYQMCGWQSFAQLDLRRKPVSLVHYNGVYVHYRIYLHAKIEGIYQSIPRRQHIQSICSMFLYYRPVCKFTCLQGLFQAFISQQVQEILQHTFNALYIL